MNIGRYLRGEDRHIGTARITQTMNILRMGFDGAYILIFVDTGKEVQLNQVVKHAHDGKSWIVTGGAAPHHENSTGKVYVRESIEANLSDRTLYPSVFDMIYKKVEKTV